MKMIIVTGMSGAGKSTALNVLEDEGYYCVDNMPISILEALASGVPVVSTDVGGIPFLVTHEKNALLVPPARPGVMAEAVLRVLNDPILANHLVEEGVKLIQEYAWHKVRVRLLAAYQQVLNNHRHRNEA